MWRRRHRYPLRPQQKSRRRENGSSSRLWAPRRLGRLRLLLSSLTDGPASAVGSESGEDRAGAPYCNNVQSPIATIQVSSIVLFRVRKSYVGNLPPMLAAFPDYPAPVVRNIKRERSIVGDIHQPLQLSFKDDRSRQRHHSERLT